MKQRILVTGGAGFIGSHLVEAILAQGDQVGVVDNLIHGNKDRIPTRADFFQKDIRNARLIDTFAKFSPGIVYHLAAQQDVGKAQEDPIEDATVNIVGTLNILECCRKTGVKRIIYADSVAGFGEPKKLPVSENHPRIPRSFYGISKHTVEHYLQAYQQYFGINFVALILANIYGPRQDPLGEGGVVAIFSYRMKHNQKINIFGDGEQTRDFIFVKDAANAFLQAKRYGTNQFHMIGTGEKTSINQLFRQIKELSGFVQNASHTAPRAGDVRHSVFDISETTAHLHWEPRTTLKQGIKETLDYFGNS